MSDTHWTDGLFRAGATQPAYVKEVVGLHPGLFFRYRVKSPQETDVLFKKIAASDDAIPLMQAFVKDTMTEWSFKDELGSPLRYVLLKKVVWIMLQNEPSDPIPEEHQPAETVEQQAKK